MAAGETVLASKPNFLGFPQNTRIRDARTLFVLEFVIFPIVLLDTKMLTLKKGLGGRTFELLAAPEMLDVSTFRTWLRSKTMSVPQKGGSSWFYITLKVNTKSLLSYLSTG